MKEFKKFLKVLALFICALIGIAAGVGSIMTGETFYIVVGILNIIMTGAGIFIIVKQNRKAQIKK